MTLIRYPNAKKNEQLRIVAIFGLGYVGLPLALLFVRSGFRVLGIDPDHKKIEMLQEGRSYIQEIEDSVIQEATDSQLFLPIINHAPAKAAEAIIICVPTPLTPNQTPDLSFLTSAASQISKQLQKNQLIVLESSTYPGTTQEVLLPLLTASGMHAGKDFHIAYSPERVDPGNKQFTLERIPKIVSGISDKCLEKVIELYSCIFFEVLPVSNTNIAEMAKIMENAYRLINISFINEIAVICDKLQLDIWEVIAAASTKPFGYHPFYPGPGIGGHCIPVDPSYLQWKIQQFEISSEFIGIANEINERMPLYVVQQLKLALASKEMKACDILVYGVSYKSDISDSRESASIAIIKLLQLEGANVYYHDPYIPQLKLEGITINSTDLTPAFLASLDGAIIATSHKNMPLSLMLEHVPLLYDTRNVTSGKQGKAKVIRLGGGGYAN